MICHRTSFAYASKVCYAQLVLWQQQQHSRTNLMQRHEILSAPFFLKFSFKNYSIALSTHPACISINFIPKFTCIPSFTLEFRHRPIYYTQARTQYISITFSALYLRFAILIQNSGWIVFPTEFIRWISCEIAGFSIKLHWKNSRFALSIFAFHVMRDVYSCTIVAGMRHSLDSDHERHIHFSLSFARIPLNDSFHSCYPYAFQYICISKL